MKGSIVRGISFSDLNGKALEEVLAGPRRIEKQASCERCGCKLSKYRDPEDTFCCSCKRALNPMFRQTA